jgi:hypothetical protein
MPLSIVKILAAAALAFCSITSATPVDLSTRDLEKRGSWNSQSTCPSGDGEEYDGPNGGAWIVRCGMDTVDTGFIQQIQTNNFIACIQACGAQPGVCGRVTYTSDVNSPGPCYLKSGGSALTASAGRKVATKLNP